jgi:hypothetical protein
MSSWLRKHHQWCVSPYRTDGGSQGNAQQANSVLNVRIGESVRQRRRAVGVDIDFSDGAHCGEVPHHAC